MIPDMVSELHHFAKNPYTGEELKFESIINIVNYDSDGIAQLGDGVYLERKNDWFTIIEDDLEVAKFRDKVVIDPTQYETFGTFGREHDIIKGDGNFTDVSQHSNDSPIGFNPPDFGITFLGTGHGFDIKDSTSGHIIWVNGKGIMVDPPPFSSYALKYYGVSPNLIDKIIISHCHADHDAGVLQKLLSNTRIEVYFDL
jgi:hypothetical protein